MRKTMECVPIFPQKDPTTGEGVMTFLGPVNPFTTSPTPGQERELLGLSMPNTIVERLRFSEGEDKDCIVVKVHVWKKRQGNNSELEEEIFLTLLLQEEKKSCIFQSGAEHQILNEHRLLGFKNLRRNQKQSRTVTAVQRFCQKLYRLCTFKNLFAQEKMRFP